MSYQLLLPLLLLISSLTHVSLCLGCWECIKDEEDPGVTEIRDIEDDKILEECSKKDCGEGVGCVNITEDRYLQLTILINKGNCAVMNFKQVINNAAFIALRNKHTFLMNIIAEFVTAIKIMIVKNMADYTTICYEKIRKFCPKKSNAKNIHIAFDFLPKVTKNRRFYITNIITNIRKIIFHL